MYVSVINIYFCCKIFILYFDFQLFLWRMRKGGHLYNITKNSRCRNDPSIDSNKLKSVCEKLITSSINLSLEEFAYLHARLIGFSLRSN